MFYIELFIYYLIAINIITFFVYGIDKLKAKRGLWRVPEATLLLLAVIGGSIGAWLGMAIWRHKTKHLKFKYGVQDLHIPKVSKRDSWPAVILSNSLSTTVGRSTSFLH